MNISLGRWFYFGFNRKRTGITGWYVILRFIKYQLMYHSWLRNRSKFTFIKL